LASLTGTRDLRSHGWAPHRCEISRNLKHFTACESVAYPAAVMVEACWYRIPNRRAILAVLSPSRANCSNIVRNRSCGGVQLRPNTWHGRQSRGEGMRPGRQFGIRIDNRKPALALHIEARSCCTWDGNIRPKRNELAGIRLDHQSLVQDVHRLPERSTKRYRASGLRPRPPAGMRTLGNR
jgi:hypothetical protein